MAAATDTATIALNRNNAIVSVVCKHLSVDPKSFLSDSLGEYDITSLFSNILALSKVPVKNQSEVMKWVTFASNFPTKADDSLRTVEGLNEDLVQKAVLLGDGFKPSVADIVVFSALHYFVSDLPNADMQRFPNVIRWMDYIQSNEDFDGIFGKIVVNKPQFEHFVKAPGDDKASESTKNKKGTEEKKKLPEKESAESKNDTEEKKKLPEQESTKSKKDPEDKKKLPGKETKNKKDSEDKKKLAEKETSENETEVSINILNIQVGVILKAWKHPSADSLLVEEIDVGNGNLRQVVSGLAKYYNPDELSNRRVVLITNVKPGKLRDVMSSGLVLCASNEDHTLVEPLIPPEGAVPGECISFSGYEGKPEDVLNPKKKQLDKITPHLFTDDKGVATYKGIPFMTSAGPCASSISNASIK